ncbi:MAG: PilN domain-containing protein [bacterium]|nr:PilN domain-containing protein [bacterium]MDN5835291.1 PilN domain-containing protein [bacterium]
MINLLPPAQKRQIRTARYNVVLLRYNIILVAAAIFIALGVLGVYFVMIGTQASARETEQENQAKVADYQKVEEEANEFKANLATAKSILSGNINYSDSIIKIASTIPSGVVIDQLSLDASAFGSPTSLQANAKSYDRAIALKEAFQKSSLFSDVHFESISYAESGTEKYPVKVVLGLIMNKQEL